MTDLHEAVMPTTVGWDPSTRNKHLRQMPSKIKELSSALNKYRGGLDHSSVHRFEAAATRTLQKACGNCILIETCSLANDPHAWSARHPRPNNDQPSTVETTDAFLASLKLRPGRAC